MGNASQGFSEEIRVPPSPGTADPAHELREKKRDGLIERVFLGALVGPVFAGFTALAAVLLAGLGTKWLGWSGGPVGGIGAGVAAVFLLVGLRVSVRSALVCIVAGLLVWGSLWWTGSTWFEWRIGDTLLPWALAAMTMGCLGCSYSEAAAVGAGKAMLDWGPPGQKPLQGGLLVIVLKGLFDALPVPLSVRGAVAGLFGGAIAGALVGGVFGGFSGEVGAQTIHGALGGAIGGAVLCGIGGMFGGITAARKV